MGIKYQIYRVHHEIKDLHKDRQKGRSVTRSKRQMRYWRGKLNKSIDNNKGTADQRESGRILSNLARVILSGEMSTADALLILSNPDLYAEREQLEAWGQSEMVQAYTETVKKLISLNGRMSGASPGSPDWLALGARLAAIIDHPDVEAWGAMPDMPPDGTPSVTGHQFAAVYPAAVRNVEAWKAHVARQVEARADDTSMRQAGDRAALIASAMQAFAPRPEDVEYLDRPDSSIPWLTVGAVAAGVVGVGVVGWIVLRGK